MVKRADEGLAFLLRYENVAWYENGRVRILDRRVYPRRVEFAYCDTYKEVAAAIKNMVTQSYGPYFAAAQGMALAAHECRGMENAAQLAFLAQAAEELSHARPTTSAKMVRVVRGALAAASAAAPSARTEAVSAYAQDMITESYNGYVKIGSLLASLVPDGGTVMTQCYADTVIGMTLRALREQGKKASFICPETRPYFQGSRLTASVICDMGFPATVISDNMPAYVLHERGVDVFTSAADVITRDGHIINKIGTFQIALAAKYWGIPYYVTGNPDPDHAGVSGIRIEQRDPEEVLCAIGTHITMQGVQGYYPAFDITPPELCAGVITDRGVLAPSALESYFTD